MLNRLLLEFFKSPNNGRQVARLPDGRWLLLTHSEIMGPAELRLLVSRDATAASSLADFEEVAPLVGPNGIAVTEKRAHLNFLSVQHG